MTYTVVMHELPAGGYIAQVPALGGCIATGDNPDDAIRKVQGAAIEYLENLRSRGDNLPLHDVSVARINLDLPTNVTAGDS